MQKIYAVILFVFTTVVAEGKNNEIKPDYAGHIEFTRGNFGTYNYPELGDSISIYLTDTTINFVIFNSKEPRNIKSTDLNSAVLHLVKKEMYDNIITPDKIVPTGNYNMKFMSKDPNDFTNYILYMTHFGDGSYAEFTIIGEHDGTRLDNLLVATVTKV